MSPERKPRKFPDVSRFRTIIENSFTSRLELRKFFKNRRFQIYAQGYMHGFLKSQEIERSRSENGHNKNDRVNAALKTARSFLKETGQKRQIFRGRIK
jgi:hypothetical protein